MRLGVFTGLMADVLSTAERPMSMTELLVAIGRLTSRQVVFRTMQTWERAGLVEITYEYRAPKTDLPGVWPKARKLRCYSFTDAGRDLYARKKAKAQ